MSVFPGDRKPPGPGGAPGPSGPGGPPPQAPSDTQSREKLVVYVFEYLTHAGAPEAAKAFLREIGWDSDQKVTLTNEAPGFLHSWWNVFWDLYCTAPETRETPFMNGMHPGMSPYPSSTQSPIGMEQMGPHGFGPGGPPQGMVPGPPHFMNPQMRPQGQPYPGMPPGGNPRFGVRPMMSPDMRFGGPQQMFVPGDQGGPRGFPQGPRMNPGPSPSPGQQHLYQRMNNPQLMSLGNGWPPASSSSVPPMMSNGPIAHSPVTSEFHTMTPGPFRPPTGPPGPSHDEQMNGGSPRGPPGPEQSEIQKIKECMMAETRQFEAGDKPPNPGEPQFLMGMGMNM